MMNWRKSSLSDNVQNCVELARPANGALVRDSKAPGAGTINLTAASWMAFLTAVKDGKLDLA
jgi:hypothetical protein